MIGLTSISCLEKGLDIDSELDGVSGRSRSEVVLASLEPVAPCVEMHRAHLANIRILLIKIQTLGLTDVRASSNRQIHHSLLFDFPNSLINLFDIIRNLPNALDTSIVSNNSVFDFGGPQVQVNQVFNQMFVDTDELS